MYRDYVEGLRKSITRVTKAVKNNVQLSFLEQLDYDFKRELLFFALEEKTVYGRFFKRNLNVDFRVASFLAYCFDDIMSLYDEGGYSFKELSSMAKNYCRTAWYQRVSLDRYYVDCYDRNGVFYIDLIVDQQIVYTFEISSLKSAALELIHLVSFLGCEGYKEGYYQDKVEEYLVNVFKVVMMSKECKPLIERSLSQHTLQRFVEREKRSAKIIQYRAIS